MVEDENSIVKPDNVELVIEALQSGSTERIQAVADVVHPGDVEVAFERLDDAVRSEVLAQLPSDLLAEWADYLHAADVERRLSTLPKMEQREVLNSLSDDELVDLLQEMEEEDRPQFIELLAEDKRLVSEDLMRFPEETAGGRMTMAMATISEGRTVKGALDELEVLRDEAEILSRIFVLDSDRRIQGIVRLRDLAFSTWDTPVTELMSDDVMTIEAMEDQEEAAQMIARYDLMALPVVDNENRLLGVITHDDALEILEQENTEDMEKISGIGGDHGEQAYLQTSVITHFKRRFGWVLALAFLALISGWVMHAYEEVLTTYFVLAIYLPMVVAAGGNTGGQAATMVIRAMALGEFDTQEFGRVIWKEARVGIIMGSLLALCVVFQIQFLLPSRLIPETLSTLSVGLVVGFSLVAQVFTSTLLGAMLPVGARLARLDPAVVASPAITTLVDVSGCIIYFSIAQTVFA
jgi:magnesium transporter